MTAPVKATFATLMLDWVGLRCRPLMRRTVLSARACGVSCRVRAREAARPVPRYSAGFTPRSRMRLLVRFRWTGWVPRLHPRCRRVLPSRMELGAKGKEGQPHWRWAGLQKTVTLCAISVTFWLSRRFGVASNGKPQERTAFLAGRLRPRPVRVPAVIKPLCDANHAHPPAKGGSTSIVCPVRTVAAVRHARPPRRTGRNTVAKTVASLGFCCAELVRQVRDAGACRHGPGLGFDTRGRPGGPEVTNRHPDSCREVCHR